MHQLEEVLNFVRGELKNLAVWDLGCVFILARLSDEGKCCAPPHASSLRGDLTGMELQPWQPVGGKISEQKGSARLSRPSHLV